MTTDGSDDEITMMTADFYFKGATDHATLPLDVVVVPKQTSRRAHPQ